MVKYILRQKYGKGIYAENKNGRKLTLAVLDGDEIIASGIRLERSLAAVGCEYAIDVMKLKKLVNIRDFKASD